jgi:hypothetical protein
MPSSRPLRVTASLLAAALTLGLSACAGSAGPEEGTTLENLQAEDAPLAGGADEGDIAEAPTDDTNRFLPDQASFLGQQVTVSGRIVEVFHPQAFVIGEGELATLVTRPRSRLVLQPGTVAQVTGTVGQFVLVEAEQALGADFAPADLDTFERAPYIAADNVNLLDG